MTPRAPGSHPELYQRAEAQGSDAKKNTAAGQAAEAAVQAFLDAAKSKKKAKAGSRTLPTTADADEEEVDFEADVGSDVSAYEFCSVLGG